MRIARRWLAFCAVLGLTFNCAAKDWGIRLPGAKDDSDDKGPMTLISSEENTSFWVVYRQESTPKFLGKGKILENVAIDPLFGATVIAKPDGYKPKNMTLTNHPGISGLRFQFTMKDREDYEEKPWFVVIIENRQVVIPLQGGSAPSPSAPAPSPASTPAPAPKPTAAPPPGPIGKYVALFIGISKYEDPTIEPLAYAAKDAQDLKALLEERGVVQPGLGKILINEEATRDNIQKAIERFLAKAGSDDVVVLFWSGHGYPDPVEGEKVYFACYDTEIKDPASGFRMDRVRDMLAEHGARNTVVVVDACHAGKIIVKGERAIGVVPYVDEMQKKQTAPRGTIFITASQTDTKALEDSRWSNGALTYCLLKGLRGEADGFHGAGPKDGVITVGEVLAHLKSSMPEETERAFGKRIEPNIAVTTGDTKINLLPLIK